MAQQTEQSVQLQGDVLTPTGAPIRMVLCTVPVNGVMTPVAMQVVAMADGSGVIFDSGAQNDLLRALLVELQEIRRVLSLQMGIPFLSPTDVAHEAARIGGI